MKNKREITEGEFKFVAAVILTIVVAIITGIIAWTNNTSFEIWLAMFFCTLIAVGVLIYMMSS